MLRKLIGIVALGLAASASAATKWDFAYDYKDPVFAYGTGLTGSSFAAFANDYAGGCAGVAAFTCQSNAGQSLGLDDVPTIGRYLNDDFFDTPDLVLVPQALYLHPGVGTAGDAIIRFTAPISSTYRINAVAILTSQSADSNGVTFTIARNNTVERSSVLPFEPFTISINRYDRRLEAGDTLYFGVGNNGDAHFDSTGLVGDISAVPEPAHWALMISGFAMVGAAKRRRAITVTA